MKLMVSFAALAVAGLMGAETAAKKPEITDKQHAAYWRMMARLQALDKSVANAESALYKAKEDAQKEAQTINKEFADLVEDLKKTGCVVEQAKEGGIQCQQASAANSKPKP